MNKKIKITILILSAVPFIMVLGNSMLIPVLPAIQKELKTDLLHVGLLITAFSVPAGIVIPFAGALSDHLGRKKVMAPALVLYGAGGILAGLASILIQRPYPYILGARILQGIGAGGTYQLAMALAGDLIPGKERAQILGLLEAGNGLGKVVSPLAGAAVGLISWYMPFFVYGVLALPVAGAVYFAVQEPQDKKMPQNAGQYLRSLGQIFKDKGVNLAISFLCAMVVLFALFGLLSLLSDLLEKKGFAIFPRGMVIALPVLIMAIASYTLGTLLKNQPAKLLKWTIPSGLLATGLGLFLFPLLSPLYLKVFSSLLVGLGNGLVLPSLNTLITSSAAAAERGVITCFYGTVRFFGVAIGPPLFGAVERLGETPFFWSVTGVVLLIGLLALLFIDPNRVLPQQMKE